MTEKCEICGATEKIQRHHISYEPEIIQLLCVDCHKTVHNHGVGKAPGWTTLFEGLKTDAEILYKEGATNKEVAKVCDISYATASHWRKKLGLGATGFRLPKHRGKARKNRKPGKTISVYLPNDITLELLMLAAKENEELKIQGKKANITDATIISRIMKDWYQKRIDAGKAQVELWERVAQRKEAKQ